MSLDFFGQLNPPQKQAVLHTEGPLLVFAGAGSGKTKVITYRVGNLIANKNVDPENILAVTFTKKAAEEMLSRVENIFQELSLPFETRPTIGTFHSIGAMILRKHGSLIGLGNNFTIYDGDDTEGLIKEIMLAEGIDVKQFKPSLISFMIGSAKSDLIPAQDYLLYKAGYVEEIVDKVFNIYDKQLRDMNAVDFSDLLSLTYKILNDNEDIKKRYQEKFKYILVDEYQDTNKVQYSIIKALAESHNNLCVVGDDDQSIYKWRGADIKNIFSFEKDFKDVTVVKLEQNYRSTANIIEAATSVIGRNSERVDKKLWTDKDGGELITVYQARDEKWEGQFIVDEMLDLQRKGYQLGDMAVLYRTNFQSRSIEEALLSQGVPYKLVGGYRFYDRKEVKDVLSYARFINNLKDDVSLFRIINVPARKMGPKSISELVQLSRPMGMSAGEMMVIAYLLSQASPDPMISDFPQEFVDKVDAQLDLIMQKFASVVTIFGSMYKETKKFNAVDSIDYIVRKISYEEFINDGTDAGHARVENIEELKNVAARYSAREDGKSLSKFLQDITLIENEQDKNARNAVAGAVTLMTLHSSKGLEFPIVFMAGMEEGIMPHSRSFTDETELEEERRLCYVGITRAREKLYLTFSESRMTRGGYENQIPSRFLTEIPQDICDFYSWQN
jgi:DNA helicase II / ATP-dependent DNA helicase PcrA